uniref:Uncharacterized protein n=1 Tax=Oryza glumipatula TaxID=40148 RepID=A0A0D9YPW5_9ORYZ
MPLHAYWTGGGLLPGRDAMADGAETRMIWWRPHIVEERERMITNHPSSAEIGFRSSVPLTRRRHHGMSYQRMEAPKLLGTTLLWSEEATECGQVHSGLAESWPNLRSTGCRPAAAAAGSGAFRQGGFAGGGGGTAGRARQTGQVPAAADADALNLNTGMAASAALSRPPPPPLFLAAAPPPPPPPPPEVRCTPSRPLHRTYR